MNKTLIIIIGLLVLTLFGTCIYFVTGVSATFPPIKKYLFSGTTTQLLSDFKTFASVDSTVRFNITDTTGNKKDGYAFYFDVVVRGTKSIITYKLKCEQNDDDLNNSTISLIGVFDSRIHLGGYGMEGAGVKDMVRSFDEGFLIDLQRKLKVTIKPY